MPPLIQYTPSNLKSLHLLRHLLREASYLPDAQARSYFHNYILKRFRSYQPRQNALLTSNNSLTLTQGLKRRPSRVIAHRTPAVQRKATKALNYLRRANTGEPTPLTKVLLFTYGRMGPRRYALLSDLLRPDNPEDSDTNNTPPPLQAKYYSEKRWLRFFDTPDQKNETTFHIPISKRYSRLRSLLVSQVAEGKSLGRSVKRHVFVTPINNVWERPMPIKRARHNARRWYKDTMSRLLPALPTAEWERLRAFVVGEVPCREFVPRRTPVGTLSPEERSSAILFDAVWMNKPSPVDRPQGRKHPHTITSRVMKRLYKRLFALCSKFVFNERWKKWDTVWGSYSRIPPAIYDRPMDSVLFEGVNNKGRPLGWPKPTRGRRRDRVEEEGEVE